MSDNETMVETVKDLGKFFYTSQLFDSLRDTAAFMLRRNITPSEGTLTKMRDRYQHLRAECSNALADTIAELTEGTVPELSADSDLSEIYFACAQTTSWLDAQLSVNGFKAAHKVNSAEFRKHLTSEPAADKGTGRGNYL